MNKIVLLFVFSCLFTALPNSVFSQGFPFYKLPDKSEAIKKSDAKLNSKDIDGALGILDKAIENKKDLFEIYQERARIRWQFKNDIDGAISDLNKALEIRQDDIFVYFYLGLLKKKFKNDPQGALQVYETAQKYHPDSVEILTRIASAKSALKDFDGAFAAIKSAVKLAPESIDLQISMSNLLDQNKKTDEAISSLQSFLDAYLQKTNGRLPAVRGEKIIKNKIPRNPDGSIDPNFPDPVRRYSKMDFTALTHTDWEAQMKEINNARSLAKAFIALGKLYVAQNNIDKAFSNLDTALRIDKNQEEAYGLRGVIYLSREEHEKAIIELNKAIKIADEPYFYLNRGIAYLLSKDDKKAQKDFDDFLKLYPEGKEILDLRVADAKQKIK